MNITLENIETRIHRIDDYNQAIRSAKQGLAKEKLEITRILIENGMHDMLEPNISALRALVRMK